MEGCIAFTGSRVNIIDFDNKTQIIKKNKSPDYLYAIKTEYNALEKKFVVSTRKDVRFYKLQDGRLSYAYTICSEPDEEITVFKSIK